MWCRCEAAIAADMPFAVNLTASTETPSSPLPYQAVPLFPLRRTHRPFLVLASCSRPSCSNYVPVTSQPGVSQAIRHPSSGSASHFVIDVVVSVLNVAPSFLTISHDIFYRPGDWSPGQRTKTVRLKACFVRQGKWVEMCNLSPWST